jgi:hypothetical protein
MKCSMSAGGQLSSEYGAATERMPATTDDRAVFSDLPSVGGKPMRVAFDAAANALAILLINHANAIAHQLITRYARRMLIENALADGVRFVHIDALFSSVGLKVDFDVALLVLASRLYRMMAHRMRGYDDAQARQILRDLVDMPADVSVTDTEIGLRFHRRAHLPIVLASGLFDKPVPVPWWNGRPLRLVQ